MRHNVAGRKLARDHEHRRALRRNLVQSLIEHGELRTTIVKAKEVRPFAERLVHLAVKAAEATTAADGTTPGRKAEALAYRQRAEALLTDRAIIPKENQKEYDGMSDAKRAKVLVSRSGRRYRASTTRPGVKFTAASVIHRLFSDIGPRLSRRATRLGRGGGYTRIIKLAERRLGDGGQLALLQFVGDEDAKRAKNSSKSERRRKAAVRYTVYAGKPRTTTQRRKSTKSAKSAESSST